jgi:hypothetical protein
MTLLETYYQINTEDNEYHPHTDKQSTHDYINGYYNEAFADNSKPINLLEIGVYKGKSLELWSKHFGPDSKIYGFDVEDHIVPEFISEPNIHFKFKDAYADETIAEFKDEYFDFIVDDGPHTLQSQIDCITKWWPKLAVGGKMVIEDIQSEDDLLVLRAMNPPSGSLTVYDLRPNKGRYDDIIIELIKEK